MIDGSDGGDTVKVYKDHGSAFIRCHYIESNAEAIHILQHEGIISDGIFRERCADGDTVIGSQYFRSAGREEDRLYRLFRFNDDGEIRYYDQIWGKDDSDWRTLTECRFNPGTLDWKKLI